MHFRHDPCWVSATGGRDGSYRISVRRNASDDDFSVIVHDETRAFARRARRFSTAHVELVARDLVTLVRRKDPAAISRWTCANARRRSAVSFHWVVHPVPNLSCRSFSLVEDRMNIHKNARLTPLGRERLVRLIESGQTPEAAARACRRLPADRAQMVDLASRPKVWRVARPLVAPAQAQSTDARADRSADRSLAASVDRRADRRRNRRLPRRPSVASSSASASTGSRRSSRSSPCADGEKPGELIHIDIKKLGRFAQVGHRITGDRTGQSNGRGVGWEFVHVCIDDASRVAFSQLLPDEKKKESAVAFLKAAVAYYASLGVPQRVMTDNGSCTNPPPSARRRDLGLRHIRTKPYTPKTNGKAERFIQTALREWAYAQAYPHSDRRAAELPIWLHRYNWHRLAQRDKSKPPIQPPRSN